MFARSLLALLVALGSAGAAAEPTLDKVELYRAGNGGYESYRIPSLVATPKGTLVALCEARKSTRGDWGPIDLLLVRSTDGGRTWSAPLKVGDVDTPHRKNPVALRQKLGDPAAVTQNNPLLIADRQGTVHLLFCHEYLRAFYRRSDDDGATFSTPIEITSAFEPLRDSYDWQVLATGPGHGIELQSGRLIVPVWLSTGTGGHAHRPSVVTTLYSDDRGASWKCGEIVAGEAEPLVNPSESEAVELADGRVLLNIRSEASANRRAIATSPDGATHWTRPRFDETLAEPICMASVCRLSLADQGGRNAILFCNPNNLERADGKAEPGKNRDRRNLTVRLSHDEAQTWPIARVLESGRSAYSDLAVGPDGTIYCLYERTSASGPRPGSDLVLARFNVEWLTEDQR
jgi:sialidase-1